MSESRSLPRTHPTKIRILPVSDPPRPEPSAWRRVLGLTLLAIVVLLWVASGFLQSAVMADGTYSKPYLITYINIAFFTLPLIPLYVQQLYRKHISHPHNYTLAKNDHAHDLSQGDDPSSPLLLQHQPTSHSGSKPTTPTTPTAPAQTQPPLTARETLHLSLIFTTLWFLANYLNAASYSSTTVASSTILVSTSSVFTLLFAACLAPRAEPFSWRKAAGVLASLAGVVMVSLLDTHDAKADGQGKNPNSAANDTGNGGEDTGGGSRGSFPYKSPAQLALGDGMALASAVLYGLYATLLTARVGGSHNTHVESRVSMPLFFGFIGLVATLALWPGLVLLHFTNIEPFELFPSRKVAAVVMANATISLVSDMCWAYAVLLVGPVVVTVGLSLTIPLSLVGQILVSGQWAGGLYWVGAGIVVVAFVVVNWQGKEAKEVEMKRHGEVERRSEDG